MPRRRVSLVAGAAAAVVLGACAGGGTTSAPTAAAQPSPSTSVTTPGRTTTTRSTIEGVETFAVEGGHSDGPISYPQVPPVGGVHNPVWQPCTFYDQPVQNEKAVHSLEHGAIWVTYRPDVLPPEIDALATLARGRKDIVASPWDSGLPSPVVVTSWGRQLRLQSTTDPRLMDFVRAYSNRGPEPNAPC